MNATREMAAHSGIKDPNSLLGCKVNPLLSQLLSSKERIDEISIRDLVADSKNFQALDQNNNNQNKGEAT
jgi:hypothetical protein